MKYQFKLYVAGETPRSIQAIANLKEMVHEHLNSDASIEVIDVLQHPDKAVQNDICATPTLVKTLPEPLKKSIADLSNIDEVMFWLDIDPLVEKRNE